MTEVLKAGADYLDSLPDHEVTIFRRRFKLIVREVEEGSREFKREPIFKCAVSIGRLGFETPVNDYRILDKESPPTYTAPDEKWALDAGFTPGEKLPHDHPANPLRGAWLRLTDDGIGIHGTASFPLGQKASHGCIRVQRSSALALFDLLDVGTHVLVV